MTGAHRPPWWPHNAAAGTMFLVLTELILLTVLFTPHVATIPLKVRMEPLDTVEIVTSIEDQDMQDVLGLHDNNAANPDENVHVFVADTSDDPSAPLITTTEGPPPVADSLIISPGSASIRDEQGLIFEFPNRCPEGQKHDPSGKCRKPFAPEDEAV